MKRTKKRVFVLGIASVIAAASAARVAAAQELEKAMAGGYMAPAAPQPGDIAGVLRSLTARAGLIFVGQVDRIQPAGGVMEVAFTVQKQVLGDVGQTYTLREWSGRWAAGQQHYRVGQRVMVFLYPPSPAGLSSPVDGMAGIVPLIPMGADADPLLDVRCLAIWAQRAVGAPIIDADFGAVALSDALSIVTGTDQSLLTRPIPRPLPPGLRPHPMKTGTDSLQPDASNFSILQQTRLSDVEH